MTCLFFFYLMMTVKINVSPRSLCVMAFGIALLFSFAGAGPATAQTAASNERLTAAQVVDLQKRFQDATVACDAAALAKLMADDAMFVHGNAVVQSRAEFLDAAAQRRFRIASFEIIDPKVVFFDGGAVVTGLEDIVLAPRAAGEQPQKVRMRVSGVWVIRPDGWQLLLNQSTPVQTSPTPPAAPADPPSR
jgi:uncharacterized protein (TIGR02246 family)